MSRKQLPKQRMAVRKDRFLVGYIGAKNTVYGKDAANGRDYVDLLTLAQARRKLRDMPCDDCAIFELVPIEVNK